jgi:MoaA/NifB/PqqE/SkfB family radical SAM enzyme
LTTHDAINVCRSLADVDVSRVLLSGGEPLTRRDLALLFSEIADDIEIYVATNGASFTREFADMAKSKSVRGIDVSLDGHRPDVHAQLRRDCSSFHAAVCAISTAHAAGLSVRVSSVVTNENARFAGQLVEELVKFGVASVVFQPLASVVGRAARSQLCPLGTTAVNAFANAIRSVSADCLANIAILDRVTVAEMSVGSSRVVHIAPNGDMSVCPWMYKTNGNSAVVGNVRGATVESCIDLFRRIRQHTSGRRCPACIP